MPKKIELTLLIESKGYTLEGFLKRIGFGLRWYRIHSKPEGKRHEFLLNKINELEVKK